MITHQNQLPFTSTMFTIAHESNHCRFLLPSDPDRVLDSVPETYYEKDRFLPYWAENWPSAAPFFKYLMNTEIPPAARVLELGCGLGVLATALAKRAIFSVGIDISPESCKYAAFNIFSNGGVPRVIAADWRSVPVKKVFDLLIASDVLYEERWISVVLTCIDTLLTTHGKALIADPCRRFWQPFKDAALDGGYSVQTVYREKAAASDSVIEIIELSRSGGPRL